MPLRAFNKLPDDERDRILAACLAEFADHGYAQASTNAIVERLGIAKGSIFYWFGSKDELYLYLVDRAVERFIAAFQEASREWPDEILARLRIVTESSLSVVERYPDDYRLFMSFMDGEARHLLSPYLKERMPRGVAMWSDWFSGVDARDFRVAEEEVRRLLMWVVAGIKVEVFALLGRGGAEGSFRGHFMARLEAVIRLLAYAIYRDPAIKGYE